MIIKYKQLQTRFNKASKSYDAVATVQRIAADSMISKLLSTHNFNPKTILDLGTGTGYIPGLLLPRLQKSTFYLNDIANKMLETCKEKFSKHKNVYYLSGDMLKLNEDIYDCVISNLALQWVDDLNTALKLFHSKSSEIFSFSTLLDGTFDEWRNILNKYQPLQLQQYPQAEELISICKKLKRHDQTFEFWLMDAPMSFDNPRAFMHYLKQLGASASDTLVNLCNLKKLLQAEHQSITVTYKIFFGTFRRVIS